MSNSASRDHSTASGSSQVSPSVQLLKRLIEHLGEELAGYRKRALQAEARLNSLNESVSDGGITVEQSLALKNENDELRARLEEATARTNLLLNKIRFLRQQSEREE